MTRAPALTLHRPWTTCITALAADIAKRIENRGWVTRYRGDLWLHAGLRFDVAALDTLQVRAAGTTMSGSPADHPTGPWAMPGQVHWRITNVRPLASPVPCRGAQRLWGLPADVEAACQAQLVGAVA